MKRNFLRTLLVIGLFLVFLWNLSCDKGNIVEPRLSGENDTDPSYSHEQYRDSIIFGIDVWVSTYVDAVIINNSGEIVKDIYHQTLPAGGNRYVWQFLDNDNNIVENGNYCFSYWTNDRYTREGNIWIKVDR